jgi:hypothetical protein
MNIFKHISLILCISAFAVNTLINENINIIYNYHYIKLFQQMLKQYIMLKDGGG